MAIDPVQFIGAAVGVISTGIIGWIGIVRRVDSKIGRDEFHTNLERRDTRVQEDLRRVLEKLDKQNEASAEYRALTTEQLREMREDIAVLKDRAGRRRGPKV